MLGPIRPPLQPLFFLEQSTSCCSEKDWRVPVERNMDPSMAPVEEKAQHDPHCPWFFTLVTAPLVTQLTESSRLEVSRISASKLLVCAPLYARSLLYSASVQSENWLWALSELWRAILLRVFLNWSSLNSNSALVP